MYTLLLNLSTLTENIRFLANWPKNWARDPIFDEKMARNFFWNLDFFLHIHDQKTISRLFVPITVEKKHFFTSMTDLSPHPISLSGLSGGVLICIISGYRICLKPSFFAIKQSLFGVLSCHVGSAPRVVWASQHRLGGMWIPPVCILPSLSSLESILWLIKLTGSV